MLAPNASTAAGVSVSETTAPKLTAVWRAVALLSGVVASLPLKHYADAEGGRAEHSNRLLRRPHPSFTRFELVELIMVHLLLSGNAYLVKQRNGLAEVVGLLPVAPNQVIPKVDDDGVKTFECPGKDQPRITVGSDVILHIPGMGYDGARGWNPIAMCRQALAVGLAAEEFSARFFSNGSHLGGILQTDSELTPGQATEAKDTFIARTAGLAKAHEVAVLHKGLKYQQVGIAPEDAQLIESRQFTIQDVGRLFGLPNHVLNEASGSTSWGSGLSEQVRGLLVFTMGPWISRIEDRLSDELAPEDEYFEFTRAGLLQSTTKERYEVYKIGIETGVLTIDECREMENLPALDKPEEQE
ncbi:MAG TPA: phage portal protein [Acidimicrobiales bacterium]|nr:phage portal protein [Acidimicrobiales bacterium]